MNRKLVAVVSQNDNFLSGAGKPGDVFSNIVKEFFNINITYFDEIELE